MVGLYSQEFVQRFFAKIDQSGKCWLWMASRDRKGYGQIMWSGRKGRLLRAHRVAWELAHGSIPSGLQVCHRCDVRQCVNPAHLFLGTNNDNVSDMHSKGRNVDPPISCGELHPRAKFTRDDIQYIRQQVAAGVTQRDIARKFSVCFSTINHIVTGRNWSTT